MSLEQALAQEGDNIEMVLDNAELLLEDKDSVLYTDDAMRQKVADCLLFIHSFIDYVVIMTIVVLELMNVVKMRIQEILLSIFHVCHTHYIYLHFFN